MRKNICYDDRIIKAHFNSNQKSVAIYLMNEAPGPSEAKSGIPLFGQQGGNLYRTLKRNGFKWAQLEFSWPVKSEKDYPKISKTLSGRFETKKHFLDLRAKHIVCSNSYDRWPRPCDNLDSFTAPAEDEILSKDNLLRIQNELHTSQPQVLLLCGKCSYLACTGEHIENPAEIEGQEVEVKIRKLIKERLNYNFNKIYYLGHTRRWSMNSEKIDKAFRNIKNFVKQ